MKTPSDFNVLIGFEESQRVCMQFRKRGFNAFSCDLKPCSGNNPQYHYNVDFFKALTYKQWDFIGIHPPCTALTVSGNATYAGGKKKHSERLASIDWTIALWEHVKKHTRHAYMENPVGAMNSDKRLKPPQIVQPWMFGESEQKQTCLWLHGLPPLLHISDTCLIGKKTHTNDRGEFFEWVDKHGNKKRQSLKYAQARGFGLPKGECTPTTEIRSEIRSKTYESVAAEMAKQWGHYLLFRESYLVFLWNNRQG